MAVGQSAHALSLFGVANNPGLPDLGIAFGLFAPLVGTLGFLLWDTHWKGSAFALNLVKNTVATILFAIAASLSAGGLPSALGLLDRDAVGALCSSSLVGVVIGDLTWLSAMKVLGARRVLVVDSLKPLSAAFAGGMFFNEAIDFSSILFMSCTVFGVLVVALERNGSDNSSVPSGGGSGTNALWGYVLAILNVVFHVAGASLTKDFGPHVGVWAVGFVRFGFAAACLACTAGTCRLAAFMSRSTRGRGHAGIAGSVEQGTLSFLPALPAKGQWYEMPVQGHEAWTRIVAGAILVTFLSPALGYVALFKVPISFWVTLDSLGPVYALPLAWLVRQERASPAAVAGSMLAAAGITGFCSNVHL